MFSGHADGVVPRHELIEGGGAVVGGETGERVGQPDLRVDAAQLAGLDHAGDDGPVIVGTGEQPYLSAQRQGTDRTLDGVGIELDATIVEEPAEPRTAGERIADRVRELALPAGPGEVSVQEPAQVGDNGRGQF